MGISVSKKRAPVPVVFRLSEDISITSIGAVDIYVPFLVNHVDFFPSGFKLRIKEKAIYIDPVCIGDYEAADYILITHSHGDHFSLRDIKKL